MQLGTPPAPEESTPALDSRLPLAATWKLATGSSLTTEYADRPGVQYVGEQIPDDRQHRQKQVNPSVPDSRGRPASRYECGPPRPVEYLFGNDRPGEQPRQLEAQQGDNRQQGVAQGMFEITVRSCNPLARAVRIKPFSPRRAYWRAHSASGRPPAASPAPAAPDGQPPAAHTASRSRRCRYWSSCLPAASGDRRRTI